MAYLDFDGLSTYDGLIKAEISGKIDANAVMVILEYGVSTWADFLAAYEANRLVYCRVDSTYGPRMAFLAFRQTSGSTIMAEFQYYRSISSHTATTQGDEIYIYTLKNNNTWTTTTRQAYTRVVAGSGLKSAYANGALTLSNDAIYELPPATTDTLGGMKVGNGLSVAADGTASIADGSITDEMLASDGIKAHVGQLWGNQLTGELTGDLLTAADAYAAPPMSLTVDGRSAQNGTPTPDAPVEIVSVVNPVLTVAGKNLSAVLNYEEGYLQGTGTTRLATMDAVRKEHTSAYIPVIAGETYIFQNWVTPTTGSSEYLWMAYQLYDSSKSLVGNRPAKTAGANTGLPQHETFVVTIPTGVAFIRISARLYSDGKMMLEAGTTATAYEPYVGTTVPLYDGTLRSLPDGTKDTMALTYLRPSTREGWAWYSGEVTRRTGIKDMGTCAWSRIVTDTLAYFRCFIAADCARPVAGSEWALSESFQVEHAVTRGWSESNIGENQAYLIYGQGGNYNLAVRVDSCSTVAELEELLAGENILYKLDTPTVETLSEVELPILPAPTCTVWADPTTGLTMEYVKDTNIGVLPPATASTLGVVKVGDGLSVEADGTLSSTGMVILEYGKSTWLECLEACEANRVVYCKVPSNVTNSRMAFLAWRESSKFEFQYYRSVSSHTATQQGDEVYTYVLNRGDAVTGFWTTATRQAYTRVVAGDGLSSAYGSGVLTLSLDPTISPLLVTCDGEGRSITMDKTAQDIYDALSAGIMPVFRRTQGAATNGFTSLSSANFDTTPITITLANGTEPFEAASMSDYPRINASGSN